MPAPWLTLCDQHSKCNVAAGTLLCFLVGFSSRRVSQDIIASLSRGLTRVTRVTSRGCPGGAGKKELCHAGARHAGSAGRFWIVTRVITLLRGCPT